MYRNGNIMLEAREKTKRGTAIMGISKTHWTGQKKWNLWDEKQSKMMTTIEKEWVY